MHKKKTLKDLVVEQYKSILLFGTVMVAVAIWLFEYHYSISSDDFVGIISACLMFFGTLLIGQGIRGWRDGEEYRNRYVNMKSRRGAEVAIKKRKKKKW